LSYENDLNSTEEKLPSKYVTRVRQLLWNS